MNTTNYLQDNKIEWDQFIGEYKESTMWDVVLDMLLAAQERMRSITPGDVYAYQISWLSYQLLEHTWKEVSHNLTEVNAETITEVLETEPPKWLADSAASYCMLCNVGGELTDFIIVLRNSDAVKTFGGNAHLSVGAGASAAAGIIGRAAEADFRAGDGGYAACYTYSCSKGAFVGCSLEGSMVTTRTQENCRFYGNPSIKTSDILLGSLPRPPAAKILYDALSELYMKVERY
ncbi:RING/FYVE/PHD-type zinc finger family protein [Tanacetum coccineum]